MDCGEVAIAPVYPCRISAAALALAGYVKPVTVWLKGESGMSKLTRKSVKSFSFGSDQAVTELSRSYSWLDSLETRKQTGRRLGCLGPGLAAI